MPFGRPHLGLRTQAACYMSPCDILCLVLTTLRTLDGKQLCYCNIGGLFDTHDLVSGQPKDGLMTESMTSSTKSGRQAFFLL